MDESKIRHLEMIQGIITRMASNSFLLKGWAVTLAAGILTLSSKGADKDFYLTAIIPIIVFWLLDSYYLQLERRYRLLFEKTRRSDSTNKPFEMNVQKISYTFRGEKKSSYIYCLFSFSEFLFYVPVGVFILIVTLLISS